jgi:hypothetical protein
LLLADDPASAAEVAQLCHERGWQMLEKAPDQGRYVVLIG